MTESDHVVREDLGDVIAAAPVGDCRLEFRFQRHSGDLWCVAAGPLATIAHRLLDARGVAQAHLHTMDGSAGARQRARYANWPRVRINDDLLIAFRTRGGDLECTWLYGEGYPFGGGGGWLPTALRASAFERARMWLSGHRGSRVTTYTASDEP